MVYAVPVGVGGGRVLVHCKACSGGRREREVSKAKVICTSFIYNSKTPTWQFPVCESVLARVLIVIRISSFPSRSKTRYAIPRITLDI